MVESSIIAAVVMLPLWHAVCLISPSPYGPHLPLVPLLQLIAVTFTTKWQLRNEDKCNTPNAAHMQACQKLVCKRKKEQGRPTRLVQQNDQNWRYENCKAIKNDEHGSTYNMEMINDQTMTNFKKSGQKQTAEQCTIRMQNEVYLPDGCGNGNGNVTKFDK